MKLSKANPYRHYFIFRNLTDNEAEYVGLMQVLSHGKVYSLSELQETLLLKFKETIENHLTAELPASKILGNLVDDHIIKPRQIFNYYKARYTINIMPECLAHQNMINVATLVQKFFAEFTELPEAFKFKFGVEPK